jgi:chorismate dehydratase
MSARESVTTKNSIATASKQRVKFGQINFINCLPLTLGLLSNSKHDKVDFVLDTPAVLNGLFSSGQLDMGSMSSYFFLENDDFELVPNVSISSKGAVGSVLFFADREPEKLAGQCIAVTSASATSINLLKILFNEEYGFSPEFEVLDRPEISSTRAGALVIGDAALNADSVWSRDFVRIDLGSWWFSLFALPMVFGVWAVRKDWVASNQSEFSLVCSELRRWFDLGLSVNFEAVLEEAARRTGLPKARLEQYYRQELNFDLGEDHKRGLALYESLCRKHGLLKAADSQSQSQ